MDPTLAQAALVLAVFETCPHPQHNFLRVASALKMMDSIIGAFQLLAMDVSDARVSIFVPGDVPRIQQSSTGVISTRTPRPPVLDAGSPENERAAVHTTWSPTPQWPTEWDLAETRKDEARRLCWTASGIVASFSHWQHTLNEAPLDLYLSSPANFALFFEAEAFLIDRDPEAAKSTLWALFHRVILLWHFTVRMAYENSTNSKRNVLAKGILEEAAMIERDLFNVTIDKGDLQKWWVVWRVVRSQPLTPRSEFQAIPRLALHHPYPRLFQSRKRTLLPPPSLPLQRQNMAHLSSRNGSNHACSQPNQSWKSTGFQFETVFRLVVYHSARSVSLGALVRVIRRANVGIAMTALWLYTKVI